MDDFATMPAEERRTYFEEAAARTGLTGQIIEKDFWVCWTLKRLFSLPDFSSHLTFKGGTSLSKVFNVIKRFSEDVDLAIEREYLGFGGENEPEKGASGKEQQRRIGRLKQACQEIIREQLKPQLESSIQSALGDRDQWRLDFDDSDPDQQSLVYVYPASVTTNLAPYFLQSIKIEFGARSDHFPVQNAEVEPYLCNAIDGALTTPTTAVRVLSAERTFWEKATILHMLHHQPEGKKIQPRMSRHYYDLVLLSRSDIFKKALGSIELLNRVAQHKSVYFKQAWARYDTAKVGQLRLLPTINIQAALERDYGEMQVMFFENPPSFETILRELGEVEARINRGE